MSGTTVASDNAPVDPQPEKRDPRPPDVSQAFLAAIVASSEDAIVGKDLDGVITSWNPAAERLYGYTAEEAIGRPISILIPPSRPVEPASIMDRLRRGEGIRHFETTRIRKDGSLLDVSLSLSPIRDTTGRIVGADGERLAISIFQDITDEMRARDRLRFLAEVGAQLAGSLDVDETLLALVRVASTTLADWAVVILTDEDGTVRHIASAHRDPEKEPLTQQLHLHQLKHASAAALLWQSIQTGEPLLVPVVTDEMMVATARNPEHLVLLRALGLSWLLYAPLISRGRVQGAIALFMAPTGRRFGEEDRDIAVEMARRASLVLENARLFAESQQAIRARDEFLSIASHELRTPVTAISGVAQVTLRAQQRGTLDGPRLNRALGQLLRGSQRLVTLPEDLLDVSRLQTGRFELRAERLDLRAFVADFVERFGAQLDERHQVTLGVRDEGPHGRATPESSELRGRPGGARGEEPSADGDAVGTRVGTFSEPLFVSADAARLEQVLASLLSNAVKYSPNGGRIVVSVAHDGGSGRVSVQDEGIGLPSGSEDAIFEPFGRAPNAAHRHIQGLGLGLYICRQLVERHGGRIWSESAGDGLGTTITFCLPREMHAE